MRLSFAAFNLLNQARQRGIGVPFFLLFSLLLPWTCWAIDYGDEVHLKNGDRITGRIIGMQKKEILISTSYAGKCRVKLEHVKCIASGNNLTLKLADEQIIIGKIVCTEDGLVLVENISTGTTAALPMTEVSEINPGPPVTYKAIFNAGGSRASGNTNATTANLSGKFQARSERNRFILRGRYNYGATDGEVDTRNASGNIKYDFFITKALYSYANALFETDEFQDLNLRSTMGVGLGYQFFDSDRFSLFGELGVSYFNEDYEESEDQQYATGRWSVGLDWALIPDRLVLFHLHEGYYSLESAGDFYIKSQQGFRVPLTSSLYVNFEYDYTYDSDPAPGTKKYDSLYILGLGYEYDFK